MDSLAFSRASETACDVRMSAAFGSSDPDVTDPEVIPPVHIPLDLMPFASRGEALKAMALSDLRPLVVRRLLVLFVVAMIRIDQVAELADFGLEMIRLLLDAVEVRVLELLAQLRERMLDLFLELVHVRVIVL